MILLKKIILYSLLLISVHSLYGQKIEETPISIELTENGINASEVFISTGDGIWTNSFFVFGQTVIINFKELNGLTKVDEMYYPNLDITLVTKKGDSTVFINLLGDDSKLQGISENSFNFSFAMDRISVKDEYTMYCTVRDTKGEGRLKMKMDFKLIIHPYLEIIKDGLDHAEVYLYSYDRQAIVLDNKIKKDEKIGLLLHKVKGYTLKNESAQLELNYTIKDWRDKVILDNVQYEIKGGELKEIKNTDIIMLFKLSEGEPFDSSASIALRATVLDRNSDAKIEINTRLFIQK